MFQDNDDTQLDSMANKKTIADSEEHNIENSNELAGAENIENATEVENTADAYDMQTVEALAHSSKRQPKMTAKGLQYKIEESKRRFKQKQKVVESAIRKVTKATITTQDADEIRMASATMYDKLDDFLSCLNILLTYSEYENLSQFQEDANVLEASVEKTAERAQLSLQQLSTSKQEGSDSTSTSWHSKRKTRIGLIGHRDLASHRSGETVRSDMSRISLQQERIQKLERAATLKAQLPFVNAQSRLKEQMETLNIQREIAGLEAGAKASKEAEIQEFNNSLDESLSCLPSESRDDKLDRIMKSMDKVSEKPPAASIIAEAKVHYGNKEVCSVSPKLPKAEDKVKGNDSNAQSGTLSEGDVAVRPSNILPDSPSAPKTQSVLSIRIPDIKIEAFSGNVVDFPSWEIAFDAIVDSHVHCTDVKINMLCQHLAGDAKSLVLGLLSHRSETSYKAARKRLKERYGNPSILCQAFLDRIEEWPVMKANQPRELQQFSDLLVQIAELRKSIGGLRILDFPQESKKILIKLPMYFENEWREAVCKWRDKKGSDSYPPFDHLVEFIERRATRANIPELHGNMKLSIKGKTFQQERRSSNNVRALATTTKSDSVKKSYPCSYCTEEQHINDCAEFAKLSQHECFAFLKEKKLCFGCGTASDHLSKDCTSRSKCKTCGKGHLTALHYDKPENESSSRCTEVCSIQDQMFGYDNSMIVPVWVRPKGAPNREVLCYCILDDQSNTCFMSNKLRHELGVPGTNTTLMLSTMHKSKSHINSKKVEGLEILDFDRNMHISLPPVFTRDHIPANRSQIPKPEIARQWEHLKEIADKMPSYQPTAEVALLIGNNVPRAIRPREIIAGEENEPYGQKSILGWGIVGTVCNSWIENEFVSVTHRISAAGTKNSPEKIGDARFAFSTKAKEVFSPKQVKEMFELDFVEGRNTNRTASWEDTRFLELLENEIQQQEDGHYVMPLPLKCERILLPNNRPLALKRAMQLARRFKRDTRFKNDYIGFMNEIIEKWAEKVPEMELESKMGKVNYVPHTGVYHNKKPDKIRIVFDCSAEFQGVSLNNYLLSGPNLINTLIGVICRFRKEKIALMTDIKSMFHQFIVCKEDRDLLRFLWWEDNDFTRPPQEYRMKVHLFGAVSSPGCANFGLKRAATDGESEFGSAAANFIRDDFYVDDGLTSVASKEEAISLIEASKKICAKAGLKLHKFLSNSRDVLASIPSAERANGTQALDVHNDPLPFERALGIVWCVEKDIFQFRIELKDCPLTKRGVLATVSSIFDPIGFAAPVLLEGKKILQELCRRGSNWDDLVPEDLKSQWRKWRMEIMELEKLEIKRCLLPKDFGEVASYELHSFSDASFHGYGQCTYARFTSTEDKVHCSFVMGKARVAPLKQVTVPRLELTAAVVSAKISTFLERELKFPQLKTYFWTDSKVVLGYINNESRRFQVYVANRIQQIRDLSEPTSWFHVKSDENPSDMASRGMSASQFCNDSVWLNGPAFLWEERISYVDVNIDPDTLKQMKLETRRATTLSSFVSQRKSFDPDHVKTFSSWFRAKRAVANVLLIQQKVIAKRKSKLNKDSDNFAFQEILTVAHLERAEHEIIKGVQGKHFFQELEILSKETNGGSSASPKKVASRKSKKMLPTYRLDPFIDDDGFLRVGGRLERG